MPLMLEKRTTKNYILFYLKTHSGWVSGTELEAQAKFWQTKSSIIARRVRELASEDKIERRLNVRRAVEYRYKV